VDWGSTVYYFITDLNPESLRVFTVWHPYQITAKSQSTLTEQYSIMRHQSQRNRLILRNAIAGRKVVWKPTKKSNQNSDQPLLQVLGLYNKEQTAKTYTWSNTNIRINF
jgi:hypothetical protein